MMSIFSYLSNFRQEEPEYITRYLHGEKITFKDIMSSRVGYYVNIYYWLFRKEYSKAPWLFILNEGYKGTIFERDIQRSRCYPQFVIFAKNANKWKEYEKVVNVSSVFGEFRKRRDLYRLRTAT
jgi:hypothetical protein